MSVATGRRLSILVIHDTYFTHETAEGVLGTSDLALTTLRFSTGRQFHVLHNWVEMLRLLGGLTGVDQDQGGTVDAIPDLMLIDCHFTYDGTAPRLAAPSPRGAPKRNQLDSSVDPRGLLYGAVLAAYCMGAHPRRPFAFIPYSVDMARAALDPYAQTFYSLLSAMSEAGPAFIEAVHYSKAMAGTPSSPTPQGVVALALRRFRRSLLALLDGTFTADANSFEQSRTAVSRYLKEESPLSDDLALAWRNAGGREDSVLLRSLFADCRNSEGWIRDEAQRAKAGATGSIEEQGMLEFLQEVLKSRNYFRDVLYPTQKLLASGTVTSTDPCWGKGRDAAERRTLAFAIAWAKDRCERKARNGANHLGPNVGLQNTQVNRALGRVLNSPTKDTRISNFPGQEFLRRLDDADEWPAEFPSWLHLLVTRHLQQLFESDPAKHAYLDPKRWPRCLRAPGSA